MLTATGGLAGCVYEQSYEDRAVRDSSNVKDMADMHKNAKLSSEQLGDFLSPTMLSVTFIIAPSVQGNSEEDRRIDFLVWLLTITRKGRSYRAVWFFEFMIADRCLNQVEGAPP